MAKKVSKQKISSVTRSRIKKGLCPKCGKDIHEGECIEDYSEVDLRDNLNENIVSDVLKVETIQDASKEEPAKETIKEIDIKEEPKEEIISSDNSSEQIKVTGKKINLPYGSIVIDPTNSSEGKKISWDCIRKICNKYMTRRIFFLGNIKELYGNIAYTQYKLISNLTEKILKEEDKINYIYSCDILYSYPSEFTKMRNENYSKVVEFDPTIDINRFVFNIRYF